MLGNFVVESDVGSMTPLWKKEEEVSELELSKNHLRNHLQILQSAKIKKGRDGNLAPFKIQYPMKNRGKNRGQIITMQ